MGAASRRSFHDNGTAPALIRTHGTQLGHCGTMLRDRLWFHTACLASMDDCSRSPNRRGAANRTFFSANDLGIGLGAMVLGGLANLSGSYALMYRFSTVLIVVFLLIYGWSFWHVRRRIQLPQR